MNLWTLGASVQGHCDYLKQRFANARFVDASDMVDQIKAIKSDEEKEPASVGAEDSRTRAAPPPPPRKKKKRSGRRR